MPTNIVSAIGNLAGPNLTGRQAIALGANAAGSIFAGVQGYQGALAEGVRVSDSFFDQALNFSDAAVGLRQEALLVRTNADIARRNAAMLRREQARILDRSLEVGVATDQDAAFLISEDVAARAGSGVLVTSRSPTEALAFADARFRQAARNTRLDILEQAYQIGVSADASLFQAGILDWRAGNVVMRAERADELALEAEERGDDARDQARRNANSALGGGIASGAGAAIGGVVGGPVGAVAGGAIGNIVGNIFGGLF